MTRRVSPSTTETVQPKRIKRSTTWMTEAEAKRFGWNLGIDPRWQWAGRMTHTVFTDDFVEIRVPLKGRGDNKTRAVKVISFEGKKGAGAL